MIKEKDRALKEQTALLEDRESQIASQEDQLKAKEQSIKHYLDSIAEVKELITKREQIIVEKEQSLAQANETINQMAMTNTKQAATIQQMAIQGMKGNSSAGKENSHPVPISVINMRGPKRRSGSTSRSFDGKTITNGNITTKLPTRTPIPVASLRQFGDVKEFNLFDTKRDSFTECLSNREEDKLTQEVDLWIQPANFADSVKESIRQVTKDDKSTNQYSFISNSDPKVFEPEQAETPKHFKNSP